MEGSRGEVRRGTLVVYDRLRGCTTADIKSESELELIAQKRSKKGDYGIKRATESEERKEGRKDLPTK